MEWMILPLKRYAEFAGRSRRKEYWMFMLLQFLISAAIGIVAEVTGANSRVDRMTWADALSGIISLAFFIPNLAVTVRRLHDVNRSGWWIVAPLIPFAVIMVAAVNAIASGPGYDLGSTGIVALVAVVAALGLGIVLFVFMLLDGTRGPNRFGPDPKGTDYAETFA